MALVIESSLRRLEGDAALQVGVLSGTGSVFSAGMDLKRFVRGEKPILPESDFAGIAGTKRTTPLIAAVEGYALAGGFEIAFACDLIAASAGANFGIPEVKRGLIAGGGDLIRLPRLIPYHIARDAHG